MRKYVPLLSFSVLVAVLMWAGSGGATGATGDPLILGRNNLTGGTTRINYSTEGGVFPVPAGSGFIAEGSPAGVIGLTNASYLPSEVYEGFGAGVVGGGTDIGGLFYGVDEGVVAHGDYEGIVASGGAAVQATATGETPNTAVVADGGTEGIGVNTEGRTALVATGEVRFSSAGLVTVQAGQSSVVVDPGFDLTVATKVLATPQSGGGTVQRVGRNFTGDTFTIYLTQPATARVIVAYFVIS
jgi:hypothetical protein